MAVQNSINAISKALNQQKDPCLQEAANRIDNLLTEYHRQSQFQTVTNLESVEKRAAKILYQHRLITDSSKAQKKLNSKLTSLLRPQTKKPLGNTRIERELRKKDIVLYSYNEVSREALRLQQQVLTSYKTALKNNLSKQQIYQYQKILNQLTQDNQYLQINTDDLTIPSLCNAVKQYQCAITTIYQRKYQHMRYTIYQMINHPYRSAWRASWFGSLFADDSLNRETYYLIRMLNYLGNRKSMIHVYQNYFAKKEPLNPKQCIDAFMEMLLQQFISLQSINLTPYGISDTQKLEAIMEPYKRYFNHAADKLHYQHRIIKEMQNKKPIFKVAYRHQLTYSKRWRRRKKKIVRPVSKGVALSNARSQAMVGAAALLAFVSNPVAGLVFCAILYTNYYLYKENAYKTILQFSDFNLFNGFTSKRGRLAMLGLAILAAATGMTMAALTFVSSMAIIGGTVGLILASEQFVTTFLGYGSLMYVTGAKVFNKLLHRFQELSVDKLVASTKQHYQQWKKAKLRMTGFYLWQGVVVSTGSALGVISIVATLGAWFLGTRNFFLHYIHLSFNVSQCLSLVSVFGLSGLLKGTFNMKSIIHFSQNLGDITYNRIATPIISGFTFAVCHPIKTIKWASKKIAALPKLTANFLELCITNPWKSTFPLLTRLKTYFIDFVAVGTAASGAAALATHGHEMLNVIRIPKYLSPPLAFGSSFGVSAGCNSEAILAELAKTTPAKVPFEKASKEAKKSWCSTATPVQPKYREYPAEFLIKNRRAKKSALATNFHHQKMAPTANIRSNRH